MPQNFFYDFRIFWEMTEQKFTYICNCPKMTEYYVNALKWSKILKRKHTKIILKNASIIFSLAPMTIEYHDENTTKPISFCKDINGLTLCKCPKMTEKARNTLKQYKKQL